MELSKLCDKSSRFLGGAKFAVSIIGLLTAIMIIATLIESYYDTDFANRLIYKSSWFFILNAILTLSIFLSIYQRLPFRINLTGFYLIHIGILTMATGSFFTYWTGLDGSLTLIPNVPTNQIKLPRQILAISYINQDKTIKYKLPYTAYTTTLNDKYQNIYLGRYNPLKQHLEITIKADNNLDDKLTFTLDQHITRTFTIDNEAVAFSIRPETINLPFKITLQKFIMTTNPGTNMPASFESIVNVWSPNKVFTTRVYMNNPLKFMDWTFYQSSYFAINDSGYGSVLSANIDPGRALKYLGAFLLVIGSIIHYLIKGGYIFKKGLL